MKNYLPSRLLLVALAGVLLLSAGCSRQPATAYQGYLEGEYLYLSAPLAGRLDRLSVQKGTQVATGAALFTLEQGAEQATLRETVGRLQQAQARLADLGKGQRPSELAALEARLTQARSAAELATLDLARLTKLHENRVLSDDDFDRARLTADRTAAQVAELTAQLETARLGARHDAIAAAEAEAAAAQAAFDRANWAISQKSISAPRAGLVYDSLFREGEHVPAGAPVVSLLPPENIKVRFFVPETDFARLKAGESVAVTLSGRAQPLTARISFLAPKPEFTPPVLYNRENRAKLVFMVEAVFTAADARDLHPGQPVEVTLPK